MIQLYIFIIYCYLYVTTIIIETFYFSVIIINQCFKYQFVSCTGEPSPELTLSGLTRELQTLTKPIQFGVSLNIPGHTLEIIQQDHPLGKLVTIVR